MTANTDYVGIMSIRMRINTAYLTLVRESISRNTKELSKTIS